MSKPICFIKIFLIVGTFAVPRPKLSWQPCRAGVPWQHLTGSTALGQEPQLPGSAALQGTWQVWRPQKEWGWGVSMHHTAGAAQGMLRSLLWHHCTSDLAAIWEDSPPRWAYACCVWFQKKWKTMFWASQNKIFSEFHYHRKGKTFLGFVPIQNKNCLEMSGFPTERKCQVLTHTSPK